MILLRALKSRPRKSTFDSQSLPHRQCQRKSTSKNSNEYWSTFYQMLSSSRRKEARSDARFTRTCGLLLLSKWSIVVQEYPRRFGTPFLNNFFKFQEAHALVEQDWVSTSSKKLLKFNMDESPLDNPPKGAHSLE